MRITRTTILAGGAALLVAGTTAAAAEKLHQMNVALPDGSVATIEYAGDVAPKVTVEPTEPPLLVAVDPFAQFDRIAAMMDAQREAMLRQVAALQQAAAQAEAGEPGQLTVVGNLPAGVHYTMVSSTTDANGCTRTVQYTSDGGSAAPKVTRASAGSCDSAVENRAGPTAASQTTADPAPPLDQQV